jgi:hypothetical protein
MLATRNGDAKLTEQLIKEGAKPDELANDSEITALDFALPYPDVVKILLKSGANPHRVLLGDSYLTVNCCNAFPSLETTKLLLHKGVNPNTRSLAGYTPLLLLAAYPERIEMLKLLLNDSRTDLTLKAPNGFTALQQAVEYKNSEAAILISKAQIKKINALDTKSTQEMTARKNAILELQKDAKRLSNDRNVPNLLKLDFRFHIFSSLDKLYKELPKELRDKKESDFVKAYENIGKGQHKEAEKIMRRLKHVQIQSQLELIRKDISGLLTKKPTTGERTKAIKQLQIKLLEKKEQSEVTLANLNMAYAVLAKIDEFKYQRLSPFRLSKVKNPEVVNVINAEIDAIYKDFSLVKDNNYNVSLIKLNKVTKLAQQKGLIDEAKEQIIADSKTSSRLSILPT